MSDWNKLIPKPSSVFLRVKCQKCGNEQLIFSNVVNKITCNVCAEVLAEPTGGRANINGEVLSVLSIEVTTHMAERKPQWPEVGDLVIATIETVTDYGAYAKLDEYEKRGLLHVSEISSSWIRNIRDFVRENQKLTLKVLRVDLEKGHIDLSLRRVTKRERIEKVLSWKKERKADALLRGVAEKVGLSSDEIYQKTAPAIEQKFDLYDAFEKAAIEGPEVLTELGVPENIAKAFGEVAQERIHVKMVKVRGVLEVRVVKPNGVKVIKEAFSKAKTEKIKDANVKFHVIAAPKYSIEVQAENYKRAEDVLQKTAQNVVTIVTKAGGQGTFRREK